MWPPAVTLKAGLTRAGATLAATLSRGRARVRKCPPHTQPAEPGQFLFLSIWEEQKNRDDITFKYTNSALLTDFESFAHQPRIMENVCFLFHGQN